MKMFIKVFDKDCVYIPHSSDKTLHAIDMIALSIKFTSLIVQIKPLEQNSKKLLELSLHPS